MHELQIHTYIQEALGFLTVIHNYVLILCSLSIVLTFIVYPFI